MVLTHMDCWPRDQQATTLGFRFCLLLFAAPSLRLPFGFLRRGVCLLATVSALSSRKKTLYFQSDGGGIRETPGTPCKKTGEGMKQAFFFQGF